MIADDVDLASTPDPITGTKWGVHPNPRNFMQFWSSRIHGLVASKKKIAELWAFHLSNVFGTKKHRRGSTYFYESASIKVY